MNKKNSPNIGHNKKSLLNSPVEHIDIKSFDARKIIDGMSKMSFTSRDTARAAAIYNEMLADKDCSIFLTLAGSTSAGGCMDLYTDLVKHNMVDAIVATGASIIDMDFFEALGFKHYQGSQFQDDTELRNNYIDRIYDTYIDEEELQACDKTICDIANSLIESIVICLFGFCSWCITKPNPAELSVKAGQKTGTLLSNAVSIKEPFFLALFFKNLPSSLINSLEV